MENITNLDITELSTKTGQKYRFDNISYRSKNGSSTTSGSYTIVALYEGRGNERGQLGLASFDLRYSELNLYQFVDTSSYTLLKIRLSLCDPIEIILPEGGDVKGSSTGVLADLLKNTTRATQISSIHRKFFNDSRGIELIRQLGNVESSNVDASTLSKYYCMAAAAALIKYVEHIQNILFAQSSLKIIYEAIDDSCLIDVNSWTNLELIRSVRKFGGNAAAAAAFGKNANDSLFDILNNCSTSGGARTLRSCILQPCVDPDIINLRLDVVEELVHNQAMLERLRSSMANLHDLQSLITLCVHVNSSILSRDESIRSIRNKILKCVELKKLLSVLKTLNGILAQAHCSFILKSRTRLEDSRLDEMAELVEAKISNNMPVVRKRKMSTNEKDTVLYAVAAGQHVLLDLARRAYEELRANIFELQNVERLGVANVELVFNYSRGYHFNLASSDALNLVLPSHCIQIVRNRASVSFTTRDLIKYNDRLVQSENEILLKSNMVLDALIGTMRQSLPALYNCVELISLLDFFSALAVYSSKTKSVRPLFGNQLIIRQGRHPILDYRREAVPNDTYAVPEARFSVIAGPNMAGKSTYMQQVCLLQILAQCGCRVPADFACFIPMTRIFSRVGHNDNLASGLSGFALEMSEMSVILQNANERTLIIIDELARSTSVEEGIGISYALCEELIASKAFVFFATHFLDLSLLELNYSVVRNFHLSFDVSCDSDSYNINDKDDLDNNNVKILKTSHMLYKGRYKGPLYGLELAELTTLPESVISNARAMVERLRAHTTRQFGDDYSYNIHDSSTLSTVVNSTVERANEKSKEENNNEITEAVNITKENQTEEAIEKVGENGIEEILTSEKNDDTQYIATAVKNMSAVDESFLNSTESIRRKKLACLAQRLLELAGSASSMSDEALASHLRQLQLAEAANELF